MKTQAYKEWQGGKTQGEEVASEHFLCKCGTEIGVNVMDALRVSHITHAS